MKLLHCLGVVSVLLLSSLPAQRVYAVKSSTREVFELDRVTGTATVLDVLPSVVGNPIALTFDPQDGIIYMVGKTTGNTSGLFRLDPTNWSAALVSTLPSGPVAITTLEWVETGTLFGHTNSGDLYKIQSVTGAAFLVGNTGLSGNMAMGLDTSGNELYLASDSGLYTLDPNTATVTSVAPLTGLTSIRGMAYDDDAGRMLLFGTAASQLAEIDLTTGVVNVFAPPFASPGLTGLMFVPGSGTLERDEISCANALLVMQGIPSIGDSVTTRLQGVTGLPAVGYGLTNLLVPFCNCTIGHEWAVLDATSESTFFIPNDPSVVGAEVFIQGLDFLGAGACTSPQLGLTARIKMTVGS